MIVTLYFYLFVFWPLFASSLLPFSFNPLVYCSKSIIQNPPKQDSSPLARFQTDLSMERWMSLPRLNHFHEICINSGSTIFLSGKKFHKSPCFIIPLAFAR
jgi:hypothetical protein